MANRLLLISILAVLASSRCVSGFTSKSMSTFGKVARPTTKRWFSSNTNRRTISMYLPSSTPTTQTPGQVAQKILTTPGVTSKPQKTRPNTSPPLSNSVLASCDTLPQFPTAHGLLSPETVRRLEQMNRQNARSEAVTQFLSTYRKKGPMSCLPMLSDPDVLPHLTEAMRGIA
mmetsp:Transcript_24615/g.32158  ORF Transcript_24615/g.32158 Transcript_24615/m.32158 type:complete len:173 (-) Transcript_24615:353-871(-)